MNSFKFRGFLWWYRVPNGSRFSPPSLTGRISHGDTRGSGEILRKMKMEQMEPIKWLIVSRGSDWKAQFGQIMAKIQSKLEKLVRLPLGF